MAIEFTENEIRAAAAEVGNAFAAYDAAPSPAHVFSQNHESAMRVFFGTAEKVQRTRRRRKVMRDLAACLAGFVIALASATVFIPGVNAAMRRLVPELGRPGSIYEGIEIAEQLQFGSLQEAVDKYVAYLENQYLRDLAVSGNYCYCRIPGRDTSLAWYKAILDRPSDEEFFLERESERRKSELHSTIAKQQAEFVTSLFGDDAWNNVTYYVEKSEQDVPVGTYIEVSTGERLTKEQYIEMLDRFWTRVAKKEGISTDELYKDGQYTAAARKHLGELPARMDWWTGTQSYTVHLLFNGSGYTRDNGELIGDVRFIVSGVQDVWEISQGITWDAPGYSWD
ncbi:MAG: hypothetical protein IJK38_08280 [Oscillospiraceae bacterium]|nr:hypothetical protein [Oscillospiraceae bacterium]